MKRLALALILCGLVISGTAAAALTCKAKAKWKKLSGEALVSFVKQCETDAYMDCVKQADDKHLAGFAADPFINTCVVKAIGASPRWCVPHYCQNNSDCTGGDGCGVCWAGLCGK
jgi:hypothetical protein